MKTTQKLDEETLERLRDHGKMGDSFNGVLNRLLDKIDILEERLEDQDEEQDDDSWHLHFLFTFNRITY